MSSMTRRELGSLIQGIVAEGEASFPVRAMERVIEAGKDAVHPVIWIFRRPGPGFDMPDVWAAILLGRLRHLAAVPRLALRMFRECDDYQFALPAAEALGRIGARTLPMMRQLCDQPPPRNERIWMYYAAGRMRARAALEYLVSALKEDTALVDWIAVAIADHGDPSVLPALREAHVRAEPWQREPIEWAIRDLRYGRQKIPGLLPTDWRLRYRRNPCRGWLPRAWPIVYDVLEERLPEERVWSWKTWDEILAMGPRVESFPCDGCGAPRSMLVGLHVCREHAAIAPDWMAEVLSRESEAIGSDDVFDVLDHIEARWFELSTAPRGPASEEDEDREYEADELRMLQCSLVWAVEQGAESVEAIHSMLVLEGALALVKYGPVITDSL